MSLVPNSPSMPFMSDAPFEERNAALKLIAADQDVIRLGTPIVAEGEALAASGKARQSEMLADYKRLAPFEAASLIVQERVKAEGLVDVKVPTKLMRMEPKRGGLFGYGHDPANALSYTSKGFAQAAAFVKPANVRQGFTENLEAMPPALRAEWFNHCAVAKAEGAEVRIRTGLATSPSGKQWRTVYGVTGDMHSLENGDDAMLVKALETSIPRGGRCRITRDDFGAVTCMEILWSSLERELRVGDPVMMGIKVYNSSNKGSAVVIEPFINRARCFNLTIAYSTLVRPEEWRIKHVGDIRPRIGALVRRALGVVTPFVEAFSDAYRDGLPGNKTRADVIGALVKRYELPESFGEAMRLSWDMDGDQSAGDTLGGLSNAITRASKPLDMVKAADMERLAGRIVVEGWGAVL